MKPVKGKYFTRRRRGFSLVELLVALAVFAFGMAGVLGLQVLTAQRARDSLNVSVASEIASATLEELRAKAANLAAEIPAPRYYDRRGANVEEDDVGAFFTVTVETNPAIANELKVKVTWYRGGIEREGANAEYIESAQRSVELSTRISNY